MTERKIPEELSSRVPRERQLIEGELPELAQRSARMREAAREDTLCGHLRQAIHQSQRPLGEIAREAGVSSTILCDFLEGERTLRSDVLDRLALAVRVSVSITPQTRS